MLARDRAYVAGVLPAAALLSLFFVAPALWALYTSLTNLALVGLDAANPRFVGLDNYVRLFGDPDFWVVIRNSVVSVIVANVWRGTAFTMIIFIGALRTIPTDIYEAARVDGATAWRRFWDHTLPNLR